MLAFDFGTKRIGVAVGDFETRLAHPLATIAAVENRARFAAIGQLVAEWRPVLLVVGLPAHADGASTWWAGSRAVSRSACTGASVSARNSRTSG